MYEDIEYKEDINGSSDQITLNRIKSKGRSRVNSFSNGPKMKAIAETKSDDYKDSDFSIGPQITNVPKPTVLRRKRTRMDIETYRTKTNKLVIKQKPYDPQTHV